MVDREPDRFDVGAGSRGHADETLGHEHDIVAGEFELVGFCSAGRRSTGSSAASGPFVCDQHASQTVLELEPLVVRADRIADGAALEVGDGDHGSVDQVEAGRG